MPFERRRCTQALSLIAFTAARALSDSSDELVRDLLEALRLEIHFWSAFVGGSRPVGEGPLCLIQRKVLRWKKFSH